MEELKIVMEALVQMGEGAQTAFIAWCIKEFLIYSFVPLTFIIIGFTIYKIVIKLNRI